MRSTLRPNWFPHGRIETTIVVLISAVGGSFFHPGQWNQNSRLASLAAFVEPGTAYTGTFRIDGLKDSERFFTGDWAQAHGHLYSNKAPGVTLLGVVPYFVLFHGERTAGLDPTRLQLTQFNMFMLNLWVSVFWTVVASLTFLRMLPRFGVHSNEGAAVVVLVYALATLVLPFGCSAWGHTTAAAFILLGTLNLFDGSDRGSLLAGLCYGAAILTEYLAGLSLILSVFVVLGQPDRYRRLLRFAAGSVPPILVLLVYQKLCFGSFFIPASSLSNPVFMEPAKVAGLFGAPNLQILPQMFFFGGRAFFYQTPILLLAVVGSISWFKTEHRALSLFAIANIALYSLTISSMTGWHGGATTSLRYMNVAIPFFCLLMPDVHRFRFQKLFFFLFAVSATNMFVLAATSTMYDASYPLFDFAYADFWRGKIAFSPLLARLGMTGRWAALLVAGAYGSGVVWVIAKTFSSSRRAERREAGCAADSGPTRADYLVAICAAVGLTMLFWAPLWLGGGVSGADVTTYFYPQKQFLVDRLRAGELPFWNNRTGFGYPLVAESQTGVFYPPTLLLYWLFDVQAAYSINHLIHYAAAFWLMWRFTREIGVSQYGALIAALVYAYGWFPPRLCWEWAIIGGAYLPGVLWCAERFVRTGRWRTLGYAAVLLGLQMLAGHFSLAFITQLLFIAYTTLRAITGGVDVAASVRTRRAVSGLLIAGTIASAFALASVQLVPTWRLQQGSDRHTSVGADFDPGYGHIPPVYLSQVIASWWYWDSPAMDREQALERLRKGRNPSATNQVEAHLYFGLLPLMLVVAVLARRRWRQQFLEQGSAIWLFLAVVAVIYTTGALMPVVRHLPGFMMFHGPARFGIVATAAMAVMAARAQDIVLRRLSFSPRIAVAVAVFAFTAVDLLVVGRAVNFASTSEETPLSRLPKSPIRSLLHDYPKPARLYAPSPNLANLFGVSSVPAYLGIAPSEYSRDDRLKSVQPWTPDLLTWAEQSGVTHVLSFESLSSMAPEGRLREVFHGIDPFLSVEPVFLYELTRGEGRAVVWPPGSGKARITNYRANTVSMLVDAGRPAIAVVRDLFYPGWTVTVDGRPAQPRKVEGRFRGVDVSAGVHAVAWSYSPW